MKKNHIIAAVVLFMLPVIAGAQALKGSYFLDNSINRHQMNPAFAPRANYFQLVGIGNIGFGLYSNLTLPTFTYPVGDKLGTFLHPSVSVSQFERRLPDHPHLDADFNTTILSFGWFTKNKSFWNVSLDTRAMIDMDLPADLFIFAKKGAGTNGERYNIGNVNLYATSALQASIGYSRDIIKGLRAGVKLRLIAPLEYMGLNLEDVSLSTSTESWKINTQGYLYSAMAGLDASLPEGELAPSIGFDLNKMLSNKVFAGLGYSIDLGAEYTLEVGSFIDGIRFSAAVTDLGQIFYNNDAVSAFKTAGSVEWKGFHNVDIMGETAFEQSLKEFTDELGGLVNLSEMEHPHSFTRSTMPRFYLGVEYPFLKRMMSVGLLYSSRLSHSYARHELTASYNLKPCKWFALGLNWSFLNTVRTMGAMIELTPKAGPSLYFGFDYIPMELAEAPILEDMFDGVADMFKAVGFNTVVLPTSMRFNFNFGIAMNLGSKHVNPKKNK